MRRAFDAVSTTDLRANSSWILRTVALLLAVVAVYSQDLAAIANEALYSEMASYILAIPFLLVYIIYRKRRFLRAIVSEQRKEQTFVEDVSGLLLCFLSLLVFLYGSYTFSALEFHLLSLPLFVSGITLILFGTEMLRALAFPVALLPMLSIPPSDIAYLSGTLLSNATSHISFTLLAFFGLPVALDNPHGSPIIAITSASGVPLEFAIEIACSGIYSLLGFTVFAVFAAYITRGPYWKKFAILILGFPMIFALNLIRVLSIVSIGYSFGQGVAMTVFHLAGGWVLVFLGTLLLLLLSEKVFKAMIFGTKASISSCKHYGQNQNANESFCQKCGRLLQFPKVTTSKRDIAKIVALACGVFLIVSIQLPAFATTEGGSAELVLQTSYGSETLQILPKIPNYTAFFMYRDYRFEKMYGQDASLIYLYTTRGDFPLIWVSLEISKTRSPLHNWDMCYYIHEQRGKFARLDLRDIQLMQDPPLMARFYSFKVVGTNLTETFLYWFESAAFDTGSGMEWKYVKTSVWADTYNTEVAEIENVLLAFGKSITDYWAPIKSLSLPAIAVREHQSVLIVTSTGLLAGASIFSIAKERKQKKQTERIYRRVSDDDKLILKAIQKAGQQGQPTLNAISSAYGRPIEAAAILEKLRDAERAGLVKRRIANVDDYPILVWINQVRI